MLKKYFMLILYSVFFTLLLSLLANGLNHLEFTSITTIVLLVLNGFVQLVIYLYIDYQVVMDTLHQIVYIHCTVDIEPLDIRYSSIQQNTIVHTPYIYQLNVIRC